MAKSNGLRLLGRAGLAVPVGEIRAAPADLDRLADSGVAWFYCRRESSGPKETHVVDGDGLRTLVQRASPGAWLVQPLLDVAHGGAAFLSSGVRYAEAAVGATVTLLRRGELAAAVHAGPTPASYAGAQATSWTWDRGELVSAPTGDVDVDRLAHACATVLGELARAEVEGLVEWGWWRNRPVYLDHKPTADTGSLATYLGSDGGSKPAGPLADALPLPDLDVVGPLPDDSGIAVRRGSRLCHAVTYRCARRAADVAFEGW